MPYRLKNTKLKQFTHLAGTPPSPFRKKKVTVIDDDQEIATNPDYAEGKDPFSIDYSGISNLEPIVISNKKISKKEEKEIISEEKSKPKVKNTIGSTEVDDIAEKESYDATMAPLITDMKDSVREATNKAAGKIMEYGLMAAPMPGAGLVAKGIGAGARGVSRLFGVGKSIPNPVFAGLTKNTVGPSAIDNLPKLNLFSRFNPKTRQQMTAALNELAQGANVSKTQRLKTISRLSSPEGQKRLYQQELGYLQDQMSKLKETIKIPQAHANPFIRRQTAGNPFLEIAEPAKIGNFRFGTNYKQLFQKDLPAQARKNVGYRMKEISIPNMNERAAAAIRGGKLNFKEGRKLLYGDTPRDIMGNNATFGGFRPAKDVGRFSEVGVQSASQFNRGDFVLGTKGNLFNPRVYQHELQHGLQVGRTLPRDVNLASKLNPEASVKRHYNKIININKQRDALIPPRRFDANHPFYRELPKLNKKLQMLKDNPPTKVHDFQYFKYGGSGQMEPSGFAGELRQSLLNRGFIRSDYQKITPSILSKAKTSFGKKPIFSGTLKGEQVSSTRLLDIAAPTKANFELISKSLNKLPTLATPVLGGKLLFSGDKN